MELISYKTNIKNETGLQRAAPFLNRAVGSANWQLDLESPHRKLTVFSPGIINEMQIRCYPQSGILGFKHGRVLLNLLK